MRKASLLVAAAILVLNPPVAIAQSKGGAPGARNSAPGQQMINKRTSATAPGKSYNAPGQKMIRQRTPGGTPTK